MVRFFRCKKIQIDHPLLALICINWHYCAITKNLFWPPFWNGITFFFKFYFRNVNVFMFCNFESNLQNSAGKTVFQILVTWLFWRHQVPFLGRHFETVSPIFEIFAFVWVILMCFISDNKFRRKIPSQKFFSGLGSIGTPPPWPPTGVHYTLTT